MKGNRQGRYGKLHPLSLQDGQKIFRRSRCGDAGSGRYYLFPRCERDNSDCKILLDQRKYQNKFDQIQNLLGLTDKERSQILSINLANAANRLYKEVWIGLGGTQSAVYATEVSAEEYLCYTTEETEKLELTRLTEKLDGNIELAIRQLAENKRQENKQSFNP